MTITNFLPIFYFLFSRLFVSPTLFLLPSAVSHYAHKLREIYLLSALEAHGTRGSDILFIKFFILKYASASSTWNNFISFHSFPYGVENLCNILVFMETFALFICFSWYFYLCFFSPKKLHRGKTNNSGRRR